MPLMGGNNPKAQRFLEWADQMHAEMEADNLKSRKRQADNQREVAEINAAAIKADKERQLAALKAEFEPQQPAPAAQPQPGQVNGTQPNHRPYPKSQRDAEEAYTKFHLATTGYERGEHALQYAIATGRVSRNDAVMRGNTVHEVWAELRNPAFAFLDKTGQVSRKMNAASHVSAKSQDGGQ